MRYSLRTLVVLMLAAGLGIIMLYVLSCGPMFAAYTHGKISFATYERIYGPLHWALDGWALDWFNWYVNEWDNYSAHPMTSRLSRDSSSAIR